MPRRSTFAHHDSSNKSYSTANDDEMSPPRIPEENLRNSFGGRRQSQSQTAQAQSQTQAGEDESNDSVRALTTTTGAGGNSNNNHNNHHNSTSTSTPTRFAARQKGGRPPGSSGTRQNFTTEQKEYLLNFLVTKDHIVHIITNTGLIRRKLLDELQLEFEEAFGEFRSTAVLLQRCKGFYEKYQEAEAAFNDEDASDEVVAERVHNKRMQICPYFDRIAQAIAVNRDQVENPDHQHRKRKRVSELIDHSGVKRFENGDSISRRSSITNDNAPPLRTTSFRASVEGGGGGSDWRQRQSDQEYRIASERLALDREIAERQFKLQDRELQYYEWVQGKVAAIEQKMEDGTIAAGVGYELMTAFMNAVRK